MTKNMFAAMLNQEAGKAPALSGPAGQSSVPPMGAPQPLGAIGQPALHAPRLTAPGVGVAKPPGTPQFSFLSGSQYKHPMMDRGQNVAGGVWAHALGNLAKVAKVKG